MRTASTNLGLGVRHGHRIPCGRSELRNVLPAPVNVLLRRPRTACATRPTSSTRTAREEPVRGAWPRHQVFCAHRLAQSTWNECPKSYVVSNLRRCPKMVSVNDVTYERPGNPARCVIQRVGDGFDRRLRPLLAYKVLRPNGLHRSPDLRPGCYPTVCDGESEVICRPLP